MTWQEAYDDACQRFGGQRPGNALEQELIEAYEARPVAFQHAVDKLAQRYADGKVRSPWPLVKAELEQDAQRALIVVDELGLGGQAPAGVRDEPFGEVDLELAFGRVVADDQSALCVLLELGLDERPG